MARPQKQTVDYYPHVARHGRTMFILKKKWGNDGYAFFHQLCELLCDTDGHVFDYRNPAEREFLLAYTGVNEQTGTEILNTLAGLGKIDAELWSKGLIWYQSLVDNLKTVYDKRKVAMPKKPVFDTDNTHEQEFSAQKPEPNPISGVGNPQSRVEESRVEESILTQQTRARAREDNCAALENSDGEFSEIVKLCEKSTLTRVANHTQRDLLVQIYDEYGHEWTKHAILKAQRNNKRLSYAESTLLGWRDQDGYKPPNDRPWERGSPAQQKKSSFNDKFAKLEEKINARRRMPETS